MKVSARNVFAGTVAAVRTGPVNAEVEFTTTGGDRIVAIITNESVNHLGVEAGGPAMALVKASSVLVLAEGGGLKLSARNCLAGQVQAVVSGPVSAEVSIRLAGGDVVYATLTRESAQDLGLAAGTPVSAVFKASSVILAVQG